MKTREFIVPFGILAAIILLILIFNFIEFEDTEVKWDYPPAVMWNSNVYWYKSEHSRQYIEEQIGDKLGELASATGYDVPTENGQFNHYFDIIMYP